MGNVLIATHFPGKGHIYRLVTVWHAYKNNYTLVNNTWNVFALKISF